MDKNLEQLCEVLDELSEVVLKSWHDDQILRNVYGWTHPPLTRQDLANIPKELSNQIRRIEISKLEDNLVELIEKIPEKIRLMYGDTVPYMFNGNGAQAIPIFLSTLEWVRQVIAPLMGWEVLQDNKAMPTQMVRRLRAIQIEIENIIPNKENLTKQISLINEATEAAENLPTDLKSLKEARNQVSALEKDSSFDRKKVSEYKNSIEAQLKSINEMHEQAKQLIENCEEAYRITTTKGLAAAFDKRASDLKWSMRLWVGGLLFALAIGAFIGHERIQILTQALNNSNISWGIISIQIVLSFTSVLAPLWFAWLATKQISQRFKLAEDYDFKASVAKAYEGYKKEAAKIDVDFEARLFNVALTRLEEAPLRLVEASNHGSPSHEFLETTGLDKLGNSASKITENVIEKITNTKVSKNNLDEVSQ
ncbi:hypothetical protein ACOCIL_15940 [Acinetobacter baumannii]|uniref:hypothetical protein n=1 Tax=Acinetobacter calcoaceticus/baumannii complex TaxID=909768 RepID=UPI0018FF2264|nr:hypothetical protein [Acinetobacter pittii]MDC4692162.1 hypothetical protein [Acinetobacter baumannii]MBJ9937565.1 hypothetical protein [Acinetobacter pittii]MDO7526635.1 hypothetical protein [Acinetobacter baumannii]MDV7472852.1 hypothetical protein [Acinetobacter baumannii]MDV7542606.1 hypothetical protein [Acinetobacter baumannii]